METQKKEIKMISREDLAACCLRRGMPNYCRRWNA